jgi:hypothetical protein
VLGSTATDVSAILTTVFAGLAVIGVGVAAFQLSEARKARLAAASADLGTRWSGERLEAARMIVGDYETDEELRDAVRVARDDPNDSAPWYTMMREADFFEDMGVLARLNAVDFRLLRVSLGSVVAYRWQAWRLAILEMRERDQEANEGPPRDLAYSEFEQLAYRMARDLHIEMPHPITPPLVVPLTGRWQRFWHWFMS